MNLRPPLPNEGRHVRLGLPAGTISANSEALILFSFCSMIEFCDWSAGLEIMPKAEPVLDSIACPSCGEAIPISGMIYRQVAERAERDLKAKSARREKALAEKENQIQAREEAFDQRLQEQVKAATADLKSKLSNR